ncbi:hypothetical protein NP511_22095 (plasmid) [Natrinema thermotolerans]|uniref:Uncharacterized protein n=1 Tax=Natrinema thermotolerans TaxID=121872 RepID=A0AAF0PH97_9EURY|nr:hypothetical protein [Natrinema thermotolerans]WMT10289.1 hypothetical protein NP511_22095 [Natrinema thermotolerans]
MLAFLSTVETLLADRFDTDEVSKTNAREFALKHAFENPDAVADLMCEEAYGATD